MTVETDVYDWGRAENGEIALAAFEISAYADREMAYGDYRAKRKILEIVSLNFRLLDVMLSDLRRTLPKSGGGENRMRVPPNATSLCPTTLRRLP